MRAVSRLRSAGRFERGLAAIAAVGLAVRTAAVWLHYRKLPLGFTDNFYYSVQARALARGEGFVDPFLWADRGAHVPSADHPPLYSLVLAAVSLVRDGPTPHRLASCLIGTATIVAIGVAARRVARLVGGRDGDRDPGGGDQTDWAGPEWAGLAAAAIAAVYPPLWILDATLVSESLYAFLVAGLVASGAGFVADTAPGRRRWLLGSAAVGAWLGLATLTRAEGASLAVFVVVPLLLTARWSWAQRLRSLGVAAVVSMVVVAPWVVRNLTTFEEPVLFSVGAGFVLKVGNCDETYHGPLLGYWSLDCAYEGFDDPPPDGDDPSGAERPAAAEQAGVDRSVHERRARDEALDYIGEHRGRLPVVVAARVGRLFGLYRPGQGVDFDVFFERRGRLPSVAGAGAFYGVAGLAAVGVAGGRRRWWAMAAPLGLLAATVVSGATAFGVTRYRVAADVGLVVLAGVGSVTVGRRLGPAIRARPLRWAVLAFVVVGLVIRLGTVLVTRPVCPEDRTDPSCYALFGFPNDANYGYLQGRLIAQGHPWVSPYLAIAPRPGDDRSFYELSEAAEPTGDDRPSAGDPPGYQTFLAALSWLGFTSATEQRVATSLVGVTIVPLATVVARRLATARAGIVAAGLAATYPMLWINDGMLLSEGLYAPLIGAVLWASYAFVDDRSPPSSAWRDGPAAVLGLAVGAAALTRAEALLLVPVLVWPLAWRRARERSAGDGGSGIRPSDGLAAPARRQVLAGAVPAATLATVVVGALYAPWIVWNLTRFDEPVLITSSTGAVLSASACDATFSGPGLGSYGNCYDHLEIDPDLDESERDLIVRRAATDYLGDHVAELPKVAVARVLRMWDLYQPSRNNVIDWAIEGRGRRASTAGRAAYFALLPLAVAGVVVLRRQRRTILPLLAPAVVVTVTAALTFGNTRYRVPVEVGLVVAAAVAVDRLAVVVEAARRARRAGVPPSGSTPVAR